MKAPVTYNKRRDNQEWFTPLDVIAAVHDVLGQIDLDPASCSVANETVRAEKFFSKENSGLDLKWFGSVYLNPPYSRGLIKKFIDKFIAEYDAEHVQSAIVLVNAATDSKWFKSLAARCTGAIFTLGRIRFMQADGTPAQSTPTCGQCFFYFGDKAEKFFSTFAKFGYAVKFPQKKIKAAK